MIPPIIINPPQIPLKLVKLKYKITDYVEPKLKG